MIANLGRGGVRGVVRLQWKALALEADGEKERRCWVELPHPSPGTYTHGVRFFSFLGGGNGSRQGLDT